MFFFSVCIKNCLADDPCLDNAQWISDSRRPGPCGRGVHECVCVCVMWGSEGVDGRRGGNGMTGAKGSHQS